MAQALRKRFGHKEDRFLEASRVVDDPKIKAVAPDIRIRGAIALLAGTDAETAIKEFRAGLFASVRFGVGPPDTAMATAFSINDPGQSKRSIVVNAIYQNEDTRLLPSVLAHEVMHSDNAGPSGKEELVANAVQSVVLAQALSEDPDLAAPRTELSRRFNTQLLALVNTRDKQGCIRILVSQGNVYPGGLVPLASFGAAIGFEGAPDNPGSRYLNATIASITGESGQRNFDLATIQFLDRRIDRAMSAKNWVQVAKALRLRLDPATPPLLHSLGVG